MTGTPTVLAGLLAECEAHGIRLLPAAAGGLTVDAPEGALTPDLLARLAAHKAALLELLRPQGPGPGPCGWAWMAGQLAAEGLELFDPAERATHRAASRAEKTPRGLPPGVVCRCGSDTTLDVPIHGGRSVRRDCGRCGRFVEFPIWHDNGYWT
jgi:hypothetical protein